MDKEYYLGLDLGTSSVGWAVTDKKYNLLRAKGKDLWGVRLFHEAQTAADRRSHRTVRRNLDREKGRIGYLRSAFADAVNEVDPGFFQRLDDSRFFEEDKTIKQPFALFSGDDYNDADYYKDYPTIFHLRCDLIKNTEARDVRLVFLAINSIFKRRGHFLNYNLKDDGIGSIQDLYSELVNIDDRFPDMPDFSKIEEIISSRKFGNTVRMETLMTLLGINKKEKEAEMLKLICGLKGQLSKVFPDAVFDEEHLKYSFSFREGGYEEKEAEIMELLDEDDYILIQLLKEIHDWGTLANIMQGADCISEARVKLYDKHAADLEILKKVYKKYDNVSYNEMFRIMADNNYSAYVGSVNSEKCQGKVRRGAELNTEVFFKRIKSDLGKMKEISADDPDIAYIESEIKKETFLPKQLTSANGVIPYQVHLSELKKILKNAENYLDFLKNTDESGYSVSERIIKIFSFQIPYYVGPLVNNDKNNAWVVRKEDGKVFPWNFEDKIDVKASSEAFIQRMVRECSYISGENVLPKCSLMYERFEVLNELNKVKINGTPISVELKQEIYNNLFMTEKKMTVKKLINYLYITGKCPKNIPIEISGVDMNFNSSLVNHIKFKEIFECDVLTFEQSKMAENIVFWNTVYGDSKKFLKDKIKENYGDILSDKQIKRLSEIRFRDWGNLSKCLLETEGADCETGEIRTLIDRMWNENLNLNECLSQRYTYLDEVRKKAKHIAESFEEFEYSDLDDLYLSAPVKRMVWQTVKIVNEIIRVLGSYPKKIFIEMARDTHDKNEKVRKDSRKKKFAELYKCCRNEGRDWIKEIENTEDNKFRSKKLYLYYTQKGRCMYTGEAIDLADLFNDNLYDIDHIYPRHFVKDDSIENNLVLVKKEVNNHKSDTYPLEDSIRNSQFNNWKYLYEAGFITKNKYERLIRTTPFTIEEQAAFINRQIVETRQGTKAIARIFEDAFKDYTEVVFSKAGLVSEFRHKQDFIKCREVNDLHHAKDAYLNIVVGNVYNTKFTRNPLNFVKNYVRDPEKYKYHMDKMFDYPVGQGENVAWITKGFESVKTVRKVMQKNTPLVTKRSFEAHGGFTEQKASSAQKAAKGEGYIPVKTSDARLADIKKYGGLTNILGSYFFLVEHTVKGKRVRSLEAMPLYLTAQLNSKEKIEKYCIEALNLCDPSVRIEKIKMYSLIRVNGFEMYLTGRSGKQLLVTNAVQLKIGYKFEKYIKKINGIETKGEGSDDLISSGISVEKNIELYNILTEKHSRGIYKKRPNPVEEKLILGCEKFKALTIEKQLYVLKQILLLSGSTNLGVDLSYLGYGKTLGKTRINKELSSCSEFVLIEKSATGLYSKEMDLLKV